MKIIDREMRDTWLDNIEKDFDAGLRPKLISGRVYPAFFPMGPGDVVLNLGCGMGPQAVTYKGRFERMVGVDIRMEKLAYAKRAAAHYQIAFYPSCCDIEHLPFPEESFDTAIAIDIIEHVINPDKFLSETYRVLRDGGRLLVTFPGLIDDWKTFLFWMERLKKHKENSSFSTVLRVLYGDVKSTALNLFKKKDENQGEIAESSHHIPFNPDTHKHDKKPWEWLDVIESSGFNVVKSRSTTLFPPLHVWGVTKFWYTNDLIFKVDSFFSSQGFIKNFGQSMVCLAEKNV
jgi:ubiquinone/menaquinone biosynthesis C-methylase UbiE